MHPVQKSASGVSLKGLSEKRVNSFASFRISGVLYFQRFHQK